MKAWTMAVCLLAFSFSALAKYESTASVAEEIQSLAEQGNPEAMYYLGMFYNNGMFVAKDPKRAFELFERAAAAGDALANYKLGCYHGGQFPGVVPTDTAKELHYKLISAQAGYHLAQFDVGVSYYQRGRFEDTLYWWNSAAKQGHAQSLYNLAVAYNEGRLAPRDLKLSYAYFKLAKLQSERRISPKAQEALDDFKIRMTTDELDQAEQMVSSWKPEPTPLTQKTMRGFAEVKRFAASGGK